MTLVRWQPMNARYPWRGQSAIQNRMNSLFDEFFHDDEEPNVSRWAPRVDVVELEDKFEFSAELPGLTKDDVKVEMNNNVLSISGEKKYEHEKKERNLHLIERGYGNFRRSFQLPSHADPIKIDAEFSNGVLKVVLPKVEEAKPKQIDIKIN